MIELILEGEKPSIEDRVTFNLRRHLNTTSVNKLYLTSYNKNYGDLYPIIIDGNAKTVTIRQEMFEKLGFKVIIEESEDKR